MSFRRENNFYDSRRARSRSRRSLVGGSIRRMGTIMVFMQNLLCDIACATQERSG